MRKYIKLLVVPILVLLGACFIQGNFDIFGWEKKIRIITVSIVVIALSVNAFINEVSINPDDNE